MFKGPYICERRKKILTTITVKLGMHIIIYTSTTKRLGRAGTATLPPAKE